MKFRPGPRPQKSSLPRKPLKGTYAKKAYPKIAPVAPTGQRVTICRALSKKGFCSRSQAGPLVDAGRVSVNGLVVRDKEFWIDLAKDVLAVDNQDIAAPTKTCLMLNKPRGVVTTADEEKDRPVGQECLKGWTGGRLSPVDRLDLASEGLLLFTNDTAWADRVLASAAHLDKTYHVQVSGLVNEADLPRIVAGVREAEGELLAAKQARLLRSGEKNCWLEIVLDESKNRHIRRLMQACGHEVMRLIRVAIGPLALGSLAKGQWRPLTQAERKALDSALRDKSRSSRSTASHPDIYG